MNRHESRAVPGLPAPHHDEAFADRRVGGTGSAQAREGRAGDHGHLPPQQGRAEDEIFTVNHALCDTGNAVTTDPNTQAVGVRP